MKQFVLIIGLMIIICIVVGLIFFGCTPTGRSIWNQYWNTVHGVDDRVTEEQRNDVEAQCRSMIKSWESEVQLYQQYKEATTPEGMTLAEEAKDFANKIAQGYNEYLMKNSYVFGENLPDGVYAAIEPIE